MGYTIREVADLLGLSVHQIRAYADRGFLKPERGSRGEYLFGFQDLVILRTAGELTAARIAPRKVRRVLARLREQLPEGRPLTAVRIAAEGDQVIVRDGASVWNPESGQALFDFETPEAAAQAKPLDALQAGGAGPEAAELDAQEWYELGCELEAGAPDEARDAYRRAVELSPHHADAHVNLGRLLHEQEEVAAAEAHYRIALSINPRHATAAFNLGVALEDLGQIDQAIAAYERALAADPGNADAHFNLAGICEDRGDKAGAFRHLKAYRKITGKTAE
jgi:tetratricopeptide (TPR) repeat protein